MRVGAFDFRPSLVPTIVVLVLLPLLIGLGVWQLDRAAGKERRRAELEARAREPVVIVDSGRWSELDGDTLVYRRVRVRGHFDGVHQYLLDNRTRNLVPGYDVYTPLRVGDAEGHVVLVNRGWVPQGPSRERLPALPVADGEVEVRGLLAPRAPPPLVLGATGYDAHHWPRVIERLEPRTIATELHALVAPLVLLMDPAAPGGFVREWHPYYGIPPARHRGYAFQWFTLALTLLVIYVVVNSKRRRGSDS